MATQIAIVDVERIIDYIERCQTADGGFFFARVPPAGAADTYHAIEALRLLGRKPAHWQNARLWLERAAANGLGHDPRTIFYLTMAGLAIDLPTTTLRSWIAPLDAFENPEGGFGS
ncbi:MAG: hypothetical protein HY664_05425 [Chloroflexi bacterium]|nr:hypothetical protein [Chloroflexota bacterium]